MALNQWFKFYGGEFLNDPKISSLTYAERCCWVTLLCLASISSEPGEIEYLTVDALLEKSGIKWNPYDTSDWDACQGVLDKFARMKMITKGEDGVIEITNWKKRQETALTNAERQRRYRESNEKVTGHVTKVTLDKIRIDKNNTTESLRSSELPIVEVEETPKERKESKSKTYEELCKWLESTTGVKIVNRAKQYAHLAKARTAEIAPSRLKARAEELLSEPWYQAHGLDWGNVVSSFDKRA